MLQIQGKMKQDDYQSLNNVIHYLIVVKMESVQVEQTLLNKLFLKNDRIIFLVIKLIAKTITLMDIIITAEEIKPETLEFRP